MTGFGYNVNGFGAYYDREVTVTASNASSVNLQTIFNNALPNSWISTIVKRYVIPSDVVLGITTVPASMAGTLIIDNSGDIQGTGGSGGSGNFAGHGPAGTHSGSEQPTALAGDVGGAGGTAMTVQSTGVTINMLSGSTLSGGGGGGGAGGQGGEGERLGGGILHKVSGGAGGSGGRGIGYNQSQTNGSAGVPGNSKPAGVDSNEGGGGDGGNGASSFGTAGATGATGGSGNTSPGPTAGSAGGAAGRAVTFSGVSAYTILGTNSGTINGAYT